MKAGKPGLLGLLGAVLSCSVAADCIDAATSWQVSNVVKSSDWTELNASGRTLVGESGTLHGMEISGKFRCGGWNLAARINQVKGSRRYDGQTTAGVPISSQSAIRQRQGQLQAIWDITATWQLGGRLSNQTLWRDIASAGGASGYPERFDWTLLSLGAQWRAASGPHQLTIAAWTGRPLQSRMKLTLPGRDPTTLAPGSISQIELMAGWRTQLRPAWHLQADIGYQRIGMGPGAHSVITRGGLPVGMAYQPRTIMVDRSLAIGIEYDF